MPEEKIEKLKKLLELTNDGLSEKKFLAHFEEILKLLLAMEKRNTEAIYKLQQGHSQMMSKMGEEYNGHYSELKGKVNNLVEDKLSKIHSDMKMSVDEMKKMMNEIMDRKMKEMDSHATKMEEMKKMMREMMDNKMKDVDNKMKDVDNKMAKDDSSPTAETIQKALNKPFEEFKKELREKVQQIGLRNRILAGPNANAVLIADLSSQCNGITKTFTVPRHRIMRMLTSTQAPFFYRPTIDFTTANLVLTINATLEAPAEGQSLFFDYVK